MPTPAGACLSSGGQPCGQPCGQARLEDSHASYIGVLNCFPYLALARVLPHYALHRCMRGCSSCACVLTLHPAFYTAFAGMSTTASPDRIGQGPAAYPRAPLARRARRARPPPQPIASRAGLTQCGGSCLATRAAYILTTTASAPSRDRDQLEPASLSSLSREKEFGKAASLSATVPCSRGRRPMTYR